MRKRMGVAWLSGLALAGVCWAGERSLQDELQNLPAEAGISVAMFDHGELSTAPIGYYAKHNWKEVAIPGAVATHSPTRACSRRMEHWRLFRIGR